MADYRATISWHRNGETFTDLRYCRAHRWTFDGGTTVPASASTHHVPAPMADPAGVDPEEAYVAALASCHMLSFLVIAANRGFVVDRYVDEAAGTMGRNAEGRLAITRVLLRPRVSFVEPTPTDEIHRAMHEEAHEQCYIANSVRTQVLTEPAMDRPDPGRLTEPSGPRPAASPKPVNVLVLGKKASASREIARELEAHGLHAQTSNDLEGATAAFDARDFDVIALGGGLNDELRPRLKEKFSSENPAVKLLDVFAPVAARQILAALRPASGQQAVSGIRVDSLAGGGYVLRLRADRECDVRVDLYHLGESLERTPLLERPVSPGPFEATVDASLFRPGATMILVTVDGAEFHTHRIERS
jgi:organic hydroperoxide reductase OsmC/OhrA